MAKIHEEFTVVDRFSGTLDKLINKYDRANKAIERTSQAERDTSGADRRKAAYERVGRQIETLETRQKALQQLADGGFARSDIEHFNKNLDSTTKRLAVLRREYAILRKELDADVEAISLQKTTKAGERLSRVFDKLADAAQTLSNKAPAGSVLSAGFADAENRLTRISMQLQHLADDGTPEVVTSKFVSGFKKIFSVATSGFKKIHGILQKIRKTTIKQTGNPLLIQTFRFAAALLTVRRIISYIRNSLERLPEAVKGPWTELTNVIKDSFVGGVGAFIQGMTAGLKKLTAALKSASGQRFLRGMEHLLRTIGSAAGWVLDKVAALVTWMGDHFEVAAAVAAAAITFLTAKMVAFGVATLVANLPILLLVAAVAGLVAWFQKCGYTAEDVFGGIGRIIGWLYAFFGNIIIEIQNILADFAEFFANFLDDPVGSCLRLMLDFVDGCLGLLENLAKGIDAIFKTNLASAVSGWRENIKAVEDSLGSPEIQFEHWEPLDYDEIMAGFEQKGREFGKGIDGLGDALSVPVNSIAESTGNIEKSVSKTEEDIKSLVDLATRKYVNNINLTAQTPVINVTGANTGNTPEDRRALAAAIRDIIVEQAASGSVRTTARAF